MRRADVTPASCQQCAHEPACACPAIHENLCPRSRRRSQPRPRRPFTLLGPAPGHHCNHTDCGLHPVAPAARCQPALPSGHLSPHPRTVSDVHHHRTNCPNSRLFGTITYRDGPLCSTSTAPCSISECTRPNVCSLRFPLMSGNFVPQTLHPSQHHQRHGDAVTWVRNRCVVQDTRLLGAQRPSN